jgi:hypothetical protein
MKVITRRPPQCGERPKKTGAGEDNGLALLIAATILLRCRLLLVRTKHVANIGSYGENAQRFVCSQSFTYPRDVLPQDVPLWLSKCFVPEY